MKTILLACSTVALIVLVLVPSASCEQDRLVLGLPPYLSATELYRRFGPLVDHLSMKLGVPVTIQCESDYEHHLQSLKKGKVDIAFLGPALYVSYIRRYGMLRPLAAFERNGNRTFRGFIVVRKDSRITSLSQLKGKKFAFCDAKSTMGHVVPRYLLLKAGIDLKQLGDHKFLDNQENVALGVLAGHFDAGAIREDVFNVYAGEGLRAVAMSEPVPDHVFVARPGLPKDLVLKISGMLYDLKDTEEGRRILGSLQKDLTALVPLRDADYDPLRRIIEYLETAGVAL